ncbi:autotransporter outer membrane beta-barrel domain-containing protein [Pseudoalteromonas sp. DL2-H2.2]|uniref:autotransporter outer membrane beta-barrel domain-containing protein n=1 Tax=Pseudoalteromonas sp. DL2-H2.2 TaxID=2908889 RepID=UPI001F1E6A22|nr:autotransporter outer membrane beta-barrel domain-containing protein [Pseudoalteromonas sp. DL2-H2.2]MCF2910200.1 autotransporter outer membrane beta-barrel domain-containing protein [Pseudoalteromonas sp. DL2-H2.2]
MNKSLIMACCLVSGTAAAAPNPSYSEIRLGFESIDYSEALNDLSGLGRLTQDATVSNPTIRQLSYSGINDDWGVYIGTAATIYTGLDTETWYVNDFTDPNDSSVTHQFGAVQTNDFKVKSNEIALSAAYNMTRALQVTMGGRVFTTSFTRSDFQFAQPGAGQFDQVLQSAPRGENDPVARFNLPGQNNLDSGDLEGLPGNLQSVVSTTEDQMSIIAAAGLRYDSKLQDAFNKFSWYADAEVTLPVYTRVQNTRTIEKTLSETFNGWGIQARAGVRYQVFKTIAVMAGVDASYKERDAISESDGNRRTVPDIEYTNLSLSAGIQWSY